MIIFAKENLSLRNICVLSNNGWSCHSPPGHGKLLCPVILHGSIVESLRICRLDPWMYSLLAERVNPTGITLVQPRYKVELAAILEVLLTQFQTAFYLYLFHAAIFRLSFNVISWLEQSLMSIELLDTRVSNCSFALPNIGNFDNFLSLALWEEWSETLDPGRTYAHLLTRSHTQWQLYTHETRL